MTARRGPLASSRASARDHGLAAAAITLVVLVLVGLGLAGGASADQTPAPSTPPTTAPTTAPTTTAPAGPTALDDAVLSWGLNDESNNKAFAPGTYNFLSAGAVPDPGRGGQSIVAPGVWRGTSARAWRARVGDVALQKRRPDGTYAAATFGGLSTGPDGTPLTSTTGPFSGHRVVLSGGRGTVDAAAGTASISWTGTFSVVYYSGFTFFTVTDPTLDVAGGTGRLRATVAGYAADRVDPEKWSAVPARRVVLADLPAVDLRPGTGFSARPAYLGVRHDGDQVREGDAWGAFPASFLDYMDRVGSAAFWYSTGGAADPHKVPLPVTVSYDAARPVTPPTQQPTDGPGGGPDGGPTAQPTTTVGPTPPAPSSTAAPTAPPASTPPTAITQPPGPALPVPPVPSVPPVAGPPVTGTPPAAAAGPVPQPSVPPTVYRLAAGESSEAVGPAGSGATWAWWLGGLLLAAAAGLARTVALGSR